MGASKGEGSNTATGQGAADITNVTPMGREAKMKRTMQVAEDYEPVEPHPEVEPHPDEDPRSPAERARQAAEFRAASARAQADLLAEEAAHPAVMQLWMARMIAGRTFPTRDQMHVFVARERRNLLGGSLSVRESVLLCDAVRLLWPAHAEATGMNPESWHTVKPVRAGAVA